MAHQPVTDDRRREGGREASSLPSPATTGGKEEGSLLRSLSPSANGGREEGSLLRSLSPSANGGKEKGSLLRSHPRRPPEGRRKGGAEGGRGREAVVERGISLRGCLGNWGKGDPGTLRRERKQERNRRRRRPPLAVLLCCQIRP